MNATTLRRLRRLLRSAGTSADEAVQNLRAASKRSMLTLGSRVQYAKPRDAVATYPQSRVQRYAQLGKLVPSAFNRRG